jgi:hypothetical protein
MHADAWEWMSNNYDGMLFVLRSSSEQRRAVKTIGAAISAAMDGKKWFRHSPR